MKYYSLGNCAFNTKPMWRNLFTKRLVPLTGAPSVRRLKTYSAQSGYVYQYFYEGQRPWQDGKEHGTEFVFTVSADRKTTHELSVIVSASALVDWEKEHDRVLTANERYAVSKMALFQAFDDRAPERMKEAVHVHAADVGGILDGLGL